MQTYGQRLVPEEEYVFWHMALNTQVNISEYNWSRASTEARQFAENIAGDYDHVWVEFNWRTGNDPALFGKKHGQTYLLARFGTDDAPLRTEEQIMLSWRRKVEREAEMDNDYFQFWFFAFEAIFAIGAIASFLAIERGVSPIAPVLFALAILPVEFFRRRHKNCGPVAPVNVWEKRALEYVKKQQSSPPSLVR